MVDYIVERKNLYAGRLVKDNETSYPVLFKIEESGLARDLLIEPPKKYQIKTEDSGENSVLPIVHNPFKLEKLLKYLGYDQELTREDLVDIFVNLIQDDKWLLEHMELFGWTKHNCGYVNGGVQVLPYELFLDLENLSHSHHRPKEPEYIKTNKGK